MRKFISFICGTPCLSQRANAEHLFWGLCLHVLLSGLSTTTGKLLGPNGLVPKIVFLNTQHRMTSLGISSLLIGNLTLRPSEVLIASWL